MIRLMFCMLTSSNSVPAGQWSRHIPFTIKFTHLLKSYNSYFILEITHLNYFLQGPSKFRPQYTQSWEYTSHLESAAGEHNGRVVKGLMQNTDRSTASIYLTHCCCSDSQCVFLREWSDWFHTCICLRHNSRILHTLHQIRPHPRADKLFKRSCLWNTAQASPTQNGTVYVVYLIPHNSHVGTGCCASLILAIVKRIATSATAQSQRQGWLQLREPIAAAARTERRYGPRTRSQNEPRPIEQFCVT